MAGGLRRIPITLIRKGPTTPMNPHPTSFDVFKPVDHVLMSFAKSADSDAAVSVLRDACFGESDISPYILITMLVQAETDIGNAGALASLGQDLSLVKAHLALQGQSFVVVSAGNAEKVQCVTEVATRARHPGSTLVIEELIPPGTSAHQTAESPDCGLDLQTRPRDDVLDPEADA